MRDIRITSHAFARYQARVKPTLAREAARAELVALTEAATETLTEIPWAPREEDDRASLYLVLSDGVVLALSPDSEGEAEYVATTTLIRGGASPERRAQRKAKRKRKAWRREVARMNGVARDENFYRKVFGKHYAE